MASMSRGTAHHDLEVIVRQQGMPRAPRARSPGSSRAPTCLPDAQAQARRYLKASIVRRFPAAQRRHDRAGPVATPAPPQSPNFRLDSWPGVFRSNFRIAQRKSP